MRLSSSKPQELMLRYSSTVQPSRMAAERCQPVGNAIHRRSVANWSVPANSRTIHHDCHLSTEAKMRFILTGFDPFDGAEMNPSQLAIERIREVTSHDSQPIAAEKVVLSTCCDEAWSLLQKEVAQIPQGERFAIVMAGLAQTREAISLERFGLNVRTYRVADNRGHRYDE